MQVAMKWGKPKLEKYVKIFDENTIAKSHMEIEEIKEI